MPPCFEHRSRDGVPGRLAPLPPTHPGFRDQLLPLELLFPVRKPVPHRQSREVAPPGERESRAGWNARVLTERSRCGHRVAPPLDDADRCNR